MKNPFKGNTLACGLLGFILGIAITFGAQQICSHKTWGNRTMKVVVTEVKTTLSMLKPTRMVMCFSLSRGANIIMKVVAVYHGLKKLNEPLARKHKQEALNHA